MAEYHVGAGMAGIYAGTINKKGDMWISKSDVTDEAMSSVFDYMYTNKKELRAKVNGKEYVMRIVSYEAESEEEVWQI